MYEPLDGTARLGGVLFRVTPQPGTTTGSGFDHRTRVGSRRTPVAQMKLSDTAAAAAAAEGRPCLMMLRQAVKVEQQGGI